MRLRVKASLALLVSLLLLAPALAGSFNLVLLPDEAGDEDMIQLAAGLDFASTRGERRDYVFARPARLFEELQIRVDAPATGYSPFAMRLLVPFAWSDGDIDLATALVSRYDTPEARRIINSSGAWRLASGAIGDLVLLNQQSRLVTRSILRSPALRPGDAKMVLWFLTTSKELALNSFIVPDLEMRQAAGLLRDVLANRRHLLLPEDIATAEKVLADFDQAERVQLRKMAAMVDDRFRVGAADACQRAEALDGAVLAMSPAERVRADPTGLVELKALHNRMACMAPRLSFSTANAERLPEAVAEARRLADRVACALQAYSLPPEHASVQAGASNAHRVIEEMIAANVSRYGLAVDTITPGCPSAAP